MTHRKDLLTKAALAFVLLLLGCPATLAGQAARKLPSADKIVGEYLKATGGKKRQAAVRDAVYEWTASTAQGEERARTLAKAPASVQLETRAPDSESSLTANPRLAWRCAPGGWVETLTGPEAHELKLRAVLVAGRLVDFKKMRVLARTVGVEEIGGEPAYVVEFSTREGGRERAWFGVKSKLMLKSADAAGKDAYLYGDYRPVEGVLVPHRLTREEGGRAGVTYALASARFNTGITDAAFEPPADATLDIPALLRDLSRNQDELDRRVDDYTFTRKITEREVNGRGEVKEKVSVYEVYPVHGWGWVTKLVSENGRPLTPERAAREEKRATEEIVEAVREAPKRLQKAKREREREQAKRAERRRQKDPEAEDEEDEDDVGIATFLRACELVSPRREKFRGRDAVVFDFRPRAGFRPSNRGEAIVSKLSGVVWVDPADRQVVRLEARFDRGFKVAGGLAASVKEGSAVAFEQTRLAEGVWLPRFSQVNLSVRAFLVVGVTVNRTEEYGDYKRFDAKTDDGQLDPPEKP